MKEVIYFSETSVILYQSTWRIEWVSKPWYARVFYATRSHIYKLYVRFVKVKHKFRKLCVTLVIFTRAACEKFHKNGLTLCQKKKVTIPLA